MSPPLSIGPGLWDLAKSKPIQSMDILIWIMGEGNQRVFANSRIRKRTTDSQQR
jgi:hypothetical protein|tara:strand:+ start:316 stop:477 length:162 start_codon:yes stop_codon:yes gene_type:complete